MRGEGTIFPPTSDKICTVQICMCFHFHGVSWYGLLDAYDRVGIVNFFCKDSDMGLLTRAHRNSVYKNVSFGGFAHM